MTWEKARQDLIDTVSFVMRYAPDRFPHREFLPPQMQMNLERSFRVVRQEIAVLAGFLDDSRLLDRCCELVDSAYRSYDAGDSRAGLRALGEVRQSLSRIGVEA